MCIRDRYVSAGNTGVDYLDFYHFLEGLTELDAWPKRIDRARPHLPYHRVPSPFVSASTIGDAFATLFDRHRASILVVSYRSDGVPSPSDLERALKKVKKRVRVHRAPHKYVLSGRETEELVFVGE